MPALGPPVANGAPLAVRILVLLALFAACLPLSHGGGDGPREELIVSGSLDGETLHLYTEWSYRGERERGRHLTIALSSGECLLRGDEPDFADRPKLPLSEIEHDLAAGPHAILHPVEGGLELVFRDGRPRKRHAVARGTRVRWVVDTTLILVEKHRLIDLETGRSLLVDGPEWAQRFAIAQGRVFAMRDGQLVVTDLHLREVPGFDPQLTLYNVGGTFGVDHVWQQAFGDDVGWTHVRADRAVALTGFRGIGPYGVEATWVSEGSEERSVGSRVQYIRIDGVAYERRGEQLSRVPADLGAIVAADARMILLANPAERVVWISVGGAPLRPFSYNNCSVRPAA